MLGEVPVPGQPLVVRLVLAAGAAEAAQLGEVAGQVLLQPGAHLGAEGLVLGASRSGPRVLAYQANAWLGGRRCHTIPGALRAAAERFGDRPAYVEGDRTLSLRRAARAGSASTAAGYVERAACSPATGSCVWAPNSIDWVVAALAVSYAGGTLVPVNSRYTGHEVADVVDRTDARIVVVADGFLGRTQIADLRAASDLPSVLAIVDDRRPRPTCDSGVAPTHGRRGRGRRRRGLPRRRRRHPLHLRHHRPLQGRDERAPADHRRRPRLGRARRGARPTTATSWSTRSSTPSATRSASWSACSPAPRSTRSRPSTSTRRCALIESERITLLPGAPTIYQSLLDAPDRGDPTSPRCGSRSPARPSCRSC